MAAKNNDSIPPIPLPPTGAAAVPPVPPVEAPPVAAVPPVEAAPAAAAPPQPPAPTAEARPDPYAAAAPTNPYLAPPQPLSSVAPPVYGQPTAPPAYGQPPVYGQAPVYGQPSAYGQTPYGQPGYGNTVYPPAAPAQGLALASMITGIGGLFFTLFGLGFLPALAAVITGHLAKKRQPWARGFWMTGLITGYIGLAISLIVGLAFVVFVAAGIAGESY